MITDAVEALYFDDDGMVHSTLSSVKIYYVPTPRYWKGMHEWIANNFGNCLQGTITHYDALGSAKRTADGFSKKTPGASTHFVIERDGSIYQLCSINNRTWHAGFKMNKDGSPCEWLENDGWFHMPNGEKTKSPNQWFVGVDLSNFGWLKKVGKQFVTAYDSPIDQKRVGFDENGKPWEIYDDAQKLSYCGLIRALSLRNDMMQSMHIRHQDSSPTRKVDPGPLFPHKEMIDLVYHTLEESGDLDSDRVGNETET